MPTFKIYLYCKKIHTMKKFLAISGCCLLMLSAYSATICTTVIDASTGAFKTVAARPSVDKSVEKTADGIVVTYNIPAYSAIKESDSGAYRLYADGFSPSYLPGYPALLSRMDIYPVPVGCRATVSILDGAYREIDLSLAPSLPLAAISDTSSLTYNPAPISPYSGYTPALVLEELPSGRHRGVDMARIRISPLQYNHEEGKLRVYSRLSYKITYSSVKGAYAPMSLTSDLATAYMEPGSMFCPTPSSAPSAETVLDTSRGYLILTVPGLADALRTFVEWKRLLGFDVKVVSRDGWTSQDVMDTVKSEYQKDMGLMYLLIVGNHDLVPACVSNIKYYDDDNIPDSMHTHITELPYGCMDGANDDIPDIYRGRWPVSDYYDVEAIANKVMWYEQQPPLSKSFYNNGVHCAYFQHPTQYKSTDHYGMERGAFIYISEQIRDYMQACHGKSISRIYWEDPQFKRIDPYQWNRTGFANGSFIPQDVLDEIARNQTFDDFFNEINNGRFYALYRGHGGVSHLDSRVDGPNFDFGMINRLDNAEWQPLFFSLTCLTGKFDEDCFAGRMLSAQAGGAIGVYASSHSSYSGPNDMLAATLFNAIWPRPGFVHNTPYDASQYDFDSIPACRLGQILDIGVLKMSEYYQQGNMAGNLVANRTYTAETTHCFGDPSMMFTTELPVEFERAAVYSDSLGLHVDLGGEMAYISFYDQQAAANIRYWGSKADYPTTNPDRVSVCISGHNRIPYMIYGEGFSENGIILEGERMYAITSLYDRHDSTIGVGYSIKGSYRDAYILVVDMMNNRFVANVPCTEPEATIGIHVPYGVYAVSLMINGYPAHTKKILVSHLDR